MKATRKKKKKEFCAERAAAKRICTNCGRDIIKGEFCLNFIYTHTPSHIVNANLCRRCLGGVVAKVMHA